uniref:Putative secreted protein n=1 Tax=Ixodes ricinus TaxID=34613 RepID=A0A6B0UD61_IXORI
MQPHKYLVGVLCCLWPSSGCSRENKVFGSGSSADRPHLKLNKKLHSLQECLGAFQISVVAGKLSQCTTMPRLGLAGMKL